MSNALVVTDVSVPVVFQSKPAPEDVLGAAKYVAKNGIQTEAQATKSLQLLLIIKDLEARVAETFGPAVKSAYTAHKQILAAQKTHTDVLEEAEKLLRAALNRFVTVQKEAGVVNALPGVQPRNSWEFTVEDLSKVPREYLMVDEKKVKGVVKAMKADTNIPGISVFEKTTVALKKEGSNDEW